MCFKPSMKRRNPMNRVRILIIILFAAAALSCKQSTKDDPWPVWILYVHVEEVMGTGTHVPVSGCASVIWRYTGESQTHTENCYEGSSFVKVWNRISEQ